MVFVEQSNGKPTDLIKIAQITDCHLYGDKMALHYGANVYQNLARVLAQISNQPDLSCIIFTGDLSQDHSEQSYQNFVDAVSAAQLNVPIYYTPGNHDELTLLNKYLVGQGFDPANAIDFPHWQIQLLTSKSATPAGQITAEEITRALAKVSANKWQLLFMHHHGVDVNYFIDRHGMQDKAMFYQLIDKIERLKLVACGHVHNAMELMITTPTKQIPLLTCPATSIQFDRSVDGVANAKLPAGYRLFTLWPTGQFSSEAVFLND